MNENERKKIAIEKYINIQRIKKHGQEEIEYQEKLQKRNCRYLEYQLKIWSLCKKKRPNKSVRYTKRAANLKPPWHYTRERYDLPILSPVYARERPKMANHCARGYKLLICFSCHNH